MKPTQLSKYLSTPAENRAPGWVVVMRGAGAPSVVHASRGAAEAEANRLIDGLPGTVDQTALVMPIASVLTRKKDVRQPVVGEAFPIETEKDGTLGPLAVKRVLRDFDEEARAMEALCGKERMGADLSEFADATGQPRVVDVPFVIKEHGIYQQRDGTIVGPIKDRGDAYSHARWTVGARIWWSDGSFAVKEHGYDLIREIVVGEGWMPWNGGVVIASPPNEKVDIVTRSTNGYPSLCHFVSSLRWTHCGEPDDILAYRPRPDR